jgi:hypothetical protein
MGKARECLVGLSQERLDFLVVHHFRAVDLGFEHQALRVYQQMPLAPFDLLAAVVAALLFSYPPVLLTDWLSTTPALGSGSRSIHTRRRLRRAACILSQVPSMRQVLK